MNFEEVKIYLPRFLSSESERELFRGLKEFPENVDERFYTHYLKSSTLIFQGDGIRELLVVNLPQEIIKPAPSIILSNTCDIDLQNQRLFPSQIVYAPIFNLEKYKKALIEKSSKSQDQILNHIESIRKQEITQIFYLPKLTSTSDESLVFLDRINNTSNKTIERGSLIKRRIFTLSDFGAYLFVLKLSIHFTRIQDKVERKSSSI